MRRLLPALCAIALLGLVWFAPEVRAQSGEVDDTIEAGEKDSRPLFEADGDEAKPAFRSAKEADSGKKNAGAKARAARKGPQARYSEPDPALELADPRTYRLKVVIRISAPDAPAKNIVATGPIPMEWPEQRVRLLSEKLSPHARTSESVMPGQAAVLTFRVPEVKQGDTAFVERMYEITRYRTKFKLPPEELELPRMTPAELREQYSGIAPGVQINDRKMIDLATLLVADNQGDGAWNTVKSFWSWTRDNVKFENGDFRGAMHALEQRCGDCEEMSALFVGLCRLSKIPARTVWVHSHDYPEFYLVDKQGKGHWIPAQVLGPAWFGEMAEYRPIFQKGDKFYDSLQKQYVRYVPQTVKGTDAKIMPQVEFHHEIIADSDINAPSYTNN